LVISDQELASIPTLRCALDVLLPTDQNASCRPEDNTWSKVQFLYRFAFK